MEDMDALAEALQSAGERKVCTGNRLIFHREKFHGEGRGRADVPAPKHQNKINLPVRKGDLWLIDEIVKWYNAKEVHQQELTRSRLLTIFLNRALLKMLAGQSMDTRILMASAADDYAGHDSIRESWVMDVLIETGVLQEAKEFLEECNKKDLPRRFRKASECKDVMSIEHSPEYMAVYGKLQGGE